MRAHQSVASFVRSTQRFPLTTFFAIAYAWTWLCWWSVAAISAGKLWLPISTGALATLGQFGPFAAALAVTSVDGGRKGLRELLSRLTRWRARPVWLVISLLLLPVLMMLAITLYAISQGTVATLEFRNHWATLPAHFVYTLLLCGPLGEEPGWRGFALPRLQDEFGPIAASVWLGVLWAGWHLPLWWINPSPSPYLLYVVSAVLMTILFTWLFNHTHGSVFYCLLFHASMNTAGVRLPEVPAHVEWIACLFAIALVITLFDRRLGQMSDETPKP